MKEDIMTIATVFGGLDGGVSCAKFSRGVVPDIEEQLKLGNKDAIQARGIIGCFAILLRNTTGVE